MLADLRITRHAGQRLWSGVQAGHGGTLTSLIFLAPPPSPRPPPGAAPLVPHHTGSLDCASRTSEERTCWAPAQGQQCHH